MGNELALKSDEEIKNLSMKAFACAMAYLALYIFKQIENKEKEIKKDEA